MTSEAPEHWHTLVWPRGQPPGVLWLEEGQHILIRPAHALLMLPLHSIIWYIRRGNLSKFPLSCQQQAGHPQALGPKNGTRLFPLFLLVRRAGGWGAAMWFWSGGTVGVGRWLKP